MRSQPDSLPFNRADAILLGLIAAVALASALPFFYAANGQLPEAGDMVIHWPRMLAFDETLRSGVYLPRWLGGMNGGYGAATTLFYAPLLYYALSAAHALTGDWVAALELVVALAAVGSGIAMYVSARALWSRGASAVAALLYVLSPYHLIDLYHRGAFAELLAFMWMPLVMWAFIKLTRGFNPAALAGGAVAMALLVLTHPPTAYLFALAYMAFVIFYAARSKRRPLLINGMAVLIMGGALAAFYALPAVLEKSLVNQSVTDLFHQRIGFINELLTGNRFEKLIGAIAVSFALLSVAFGWMARGQSDDGENDDGENEATINRRRHLAAWELVTALSLVALLPIIRPVIDAMPGMAAVAFVWRWLAVSTLAVAMLAAAATDCWFQTFKPMRHRPGSGSSVYRAKPVVTALLLILTVTFGIIAAARASNLHNGFVAPAENFEQDFTPLGTPGVYDLPRGKSCEFINASSGDSARLVEWHPERRVIETTSATGGPLHVYTLMYPGWIAMTDDSPAVIETNPSLKTMLIAIPPGNHRLTLLFTETAPRRFARWISVTALAALALSLVVSWLTLCTSRNARATAR
ncbi:MAG: 6-pyruvoyl-tetrahydropterin synthase-related protein [Blastocatellia bacterium]